MDWTTRGKRGWLILGLIFFGLACGDGGCSSCEGCGIEPIPGGFPLDQRIPNAVQVRLTDNGIAFIESDIEQILEGLMPGGLSFEVPEMDLEGIITLCPGGGCYIRAEIPDGGLTVNLVEPNALEVYIQIILTSRDADGNRAVIHTSLGDTSVDINTVGGSRDYVGATAVIALTGDTNLVEGEPWAFTKADVQSVTLTDPLEDSDYDIDVVLCGCEWYRPWCCIGNWTVGGIVSLLEGTITDLINDEVGGMVDDLLADELCMRAGTVGCPTGTTADGSGICRFESGECVPTLLGLDGQGDLGAAFLGGFAPGVHGRLRFLAALGGDGRVVNDGLSLSMFGGMQSLDETLTVAPGHNPCVPQTTPPALPNVPISGVLEGNTVPGSGASSHVGIGVSESFINHAGWGVFDSGMLCIGAGSNLSDLLTTGTLSLFIGSLNRLTFPDGSAPVAIMLQPKQPPVIDVRTDGGPLLGIALDELEVDMYAWIQERYVRFMTLRTNLALEVDLAADASGLMLDIGDVQFNGSEIINSDLITEDPANVASMLEGLVPGLVGGLLGDMDAIEMPEIEGFVLEVPEGGIQGFADGGEDFLGIFANLGLAAEAASLNQLARPVDTDVRQVSLELDERALDLATAHEADHPVLTATAKGQGATYDFEYSHRLDGQPWSVWSADPDIVIQDPILRWQGRHTLEVRARQAGMPGSTDPTPARAEVLVDILPPDLRFEEASGGWRLLADDIVSPRSALQFRYRVAGDDWADWAPMGDDGPVLDADPVALEVEVRDEAGNVASAEGALIRGLPDPNGSDACDCAVPGGGSGNTPLAGLALLLFVGAALRRRWQKPASAMTPPRGPGGRGRRLARRLLPFLALPLALSLGLTAVGCGGKGGGDELCGEEICMPPDYDSPQGTACCEAQEMCVEVDLAALCPAQNELCELSSYEFDGNCDITCHECFIPPLSPGQLATYLDMAALGDGTLVLSGYNPGQPSATPPRAHRDLVVGVYEGGEVQWEIVDGVPDLPPQWDPDGWRGGVSISGPDVGRWTSLAVAANDTLYISYYDKTDTALKLAIGTPGGPWDIHVVDDEGDSGRYTSIVLVDGAPHIAYLQMLPGEEGSRISRARVAMADGANPSGPGDWVFTTAHEVVEQVPSIEDHPIATGLFNNLFVDDTGLALVWYDRTRGNIHGARWGGADWGAPFLIDGWDRGAPNVGDSGIAASVFAEGNVWHVTYVDGVEETLRYARVEDGVAGGWQVVDDGATEGARHVVGDGSSVALVGGELRVAYQDTTAHRALLARRDGEGDWAVEVLDDTDATGFWTRQTVSGGESQVATFWMGAAGSPSGVRIFDLP
jgi:hypothetical protein